MIGPPLFEAVAASRSPTIRGGRRICGYSRRSPHLRSPHLSHGQWGTFALLFITVENLAGVSPHGHPAPEASSKRTLEGRRIRRKTVERPGRRVARTDTQ